MMLRSFRRGARDVIRALLLLAAAAVVAVALQSMNMSATAGQARAVDGDTLVVGDMRIRLRGIDAPELDQLCLDANGVEQACGRLAANHLSAMTDGRRVSCTGSEHDRYGRFLGVCHHDPPGGDRSINEAMVADGWAVAYGSYWAAERLARNEGRGIWALTFDQPQDWRQRKRQADGSATPGIGFGGMVRRARAFFGWGGHNE